MENSKDLSPQSQIPGYVPMVVTYNLEYYKTISGKCKSCNAFTMNTYVNLRHNNFFTLLLKCNSKFVTRGYSSVESKPKYRPTRPMG